MSKSIKNGLFLVLFLFGIGQVMAQTKKVTGKVTDVAGEVLLGVTILEKGATNGATTDFDGNFTIKVANDATLVFSYIGFVTKELSVLGKNNVTVQLVEDATALNEVVLVGYGTQKREAITGSVAVADLDTYRAVPVNNVLETVKGTLPGLNVGAINTAGAVASLSVRGTNSISGGNSPLIVLDGVIYNGSIGDIPTNDIENFTVLKDASAAAVYGSRSANGVILIQTKSGKGIDGKPKFSITTNYGITSELERLELYDGPGYLKRILDIRAANGLDADPSLIETYLQDIELVNYNATANHEPTLADPYGTIRQNAYNANATISISNSTEKTKYYISGSWTDQKGVILNDKYKNVTGRLNLSSDLNSWLNLGVRTAYSFRDFSGVSPTQSQATLLSPYASLYNEDGSYRQFPQTTTSLNSPFWSVPTSHKDIQNNLTGLVTATIKFPFLEGLTYTTNFSNTMRWNESSNFYDSNTLSGVAVDGRGNRSYSRRTEQLLDNMLKFNRTFKEKHNVDVTLLYSKETSRLESQSASAFGFENMVLGDYKLEDGQTQNVATGGGEAANIGQMARATYTYDKKYALTGTFRRDGFSGFSKNKKYGNFSSLGFNWNISNEKFLENFESINNLSLRISYGSTGNVALGSYSTLASVGTGKYVFGGDTSYSITQAISSLAADNLSWETTTGWNYGLNFSLFDNRVSGAIDAYNTSTTDQIFREQLTLISGGFSILNNLGQIDNKGVEVSLHTENVQKKDFNWSSDFAFSRNRNSVNTIKGEDADGDGVEDDLINSGYFIGEPLGTIYTTRVTGMYQQSDVDDGTILDGMRPGDYILEDLDGDGKITSDADRQILGYSSPNFRWSLTNTVRYKNFTLMAYLYSIWGGNGYYLSGANTPYYDGYANRTDLNHPVYDYWTPENTDALYPRPDYKDNAAYKGTKYVDRSFIKLQKVALSYDMSDLLKPHGVNGLMVTLSADNLYTYAKDWDGLDPETGSGRTWTSAPSLRTWLVSFSLNF